MMMSIAPHCTFVCVCIHCKISTLQHYHHRCRPRRRRRKYQIDEARDTFCVFYGIEQANSVNTIYLLNFALDAQELRKLPLVFHFYAGIAFI